MSNFECSPQQLLNAATNAATIGNAITTNPVNTLPGGDLGHAGVAAAVDVFRSAWAGELRLRENATAEASRLLAGAASDVARLDTLLANAISRLGGGQ
ncbi:hypothetical protein [Rathayibacter toxicus]|uniref:Uncharacterized protein n=1 Tax=Rathayibacter toxicus TaxID=145458 RepID=A0A0C5B8D0_9MICO|nr:hypothetical protein [Rathayibacter toxicus]AJM76998.1 hypothetical protein TI83_01475 [Rathayibacter toxicus]AJM77382.1 hypothetical protein TI83_04320 [Rathayibacter toxicus]ALS56725.1 hypothetical protein APU90_02150 [Rathayibacter toxicus]ALS57208.1 hypothetical protein APU90_05020 [Rathayibacter toxicus]KKM47260.1 hypothetical protein VT73_00805 [Rathayibacter toxicus]